MDERIRFHRELQADTDGFPLRFGVIGVQRSVNDKAEVVVELVLQDGCVVLGEHALLDENQADYVAIASNQVNLLWMINSRTVHYVV